jgi:hypothetical protein
VPGTGLATHIAAAQLEVSVVAGSVQLVAGRRVIRVHSARHDPKKEHGAFAVPSGRPNRRAT